MATVTANQTEVLAARAWFASVCEGDFSATIRLYTYHPSEEASATGFHDEIVWTVRWKGKDNLMMGNVGESLDDLLVHAFRTTQPED